MQQYYTQRITVDSLAGKPTIKGTNIPVGLIFQQLSQNPDAKTVLRANPPEDIKACFAYAKEVIEKEGTSLFEKDKRDCKPTAEAQETKRVPYRIYTDEEIDQFLEDDKLPDELVQELQQNYPSWKAAIEIRELAVKQAAVEEILPGTLADLQRLLSWPEGWNGYDACAPKHGAVNHAIEWINQLFLEVMDSDENWIKPNVTASGDGEAVFGWKHDAKRLTVYIDEERAEYVQAWGPDMNKEMNDGDADLPSTRQSLWKWLVAQA